MENHSNSKCPRCSKEMRSFHDYPQCVTCGYQDYTTKIVEESITLPDSFRGNLYLAHYRGLTLVNKDVVVKIKLEDVIKSHNNEPKLVPECPKCQSDMTLNRHRVATWANTKWYECSAVTSHMIFLNFSLLYWSDTYGY